MTETARAAEYAARAAYGRMLAYLTSRCGDLTAAEDALSEAFLKALERWPRDGVPTQPEAWLLTVARRKMVDAYRRGERLEPLNAIPPYREMTELFDSVGAGIPDVRLSLMLLCAHPAIDSSIRAALMLQTVLGIDVRSMASAFLISPDALAKRLTRAKRKIRDAGVRFERPEATLLPERLHDVLEAIYAAYVLGNDASLVAADSSAELSREALYLAELVVSLRPDDAEALGFLALVSFCEARRPASISAGDEFVPLLDQDTRLWDSDRIEHANELLARAARLRSPGPFQIEAAIQAAHCYRLYSGDTPWNEIARLYDVLAERHGTIASTVCRAVAHTYATGDPAFGFALLAGLESAAVARYQPWWLARAHLLELAGEPAAAADATRRGIGLTAHPRTKRFLIRRLASYEAAKEQPSD